MARKKTEHYATRLKRELAEAITRLDKLYDYRYHARFEVLGEHDEVYGGSELVANEEGVACRDVERLREIILNMP